MLETFTFDSRDADDMATFLTSQRLDGVTFTRGRFWQPDFTVTAPAWRIPRLRAQVNSLLDAEEDSLAW